MGVQDKGQASEFGDTSTETFFISDKSDWIKNRLVWDDTSTKNGY